jgi:hypothetical protein
MKRQVPVKSTGPKGKAALLGGFLARQLFLKFNEEEKRGAGEREKRGARLPKNGRHTAAPEVVGSALSITFICEEAAAQKN